MRRDVVLVLRVTSNNRHVLQKIWVGPTAHSVIKRSGDWLGRRERKRKVYLWTPERDAFILENYKRYPKKRVARMLSEKYGTHYTKNAVIGRYNRHLKTLNK